MFASFSLRRPHFTTVRHAWIYLFRDLKILQTDRREKMRLGMGLLALKYFAGIDAVWQDAHKQHYYGQSIPDARSSPGGVSKISYSKT